MYHCFCRYAPKPLESLSLCRTCDAPASSRSGWTALASNRVLEICCRFAPKPLESLSLCRTCDAPVSSRSGWTALASNRVSKICCRFASQTTCGSLQQVSFLLLAAKILLIANWRTVKTGCHRQLLFLRAAIRQ